MKKRMLRKITADTAEASEEISEEVSEAGNTETEETADSSIDEAALVNETELRVG